MSGKSDHYNVVAKIFHWVMGLIMLGLIIVGLYMSGMEYGPEKLQLIMMHKSFGLLIFWLVGLRIIWRHIKRPPASHPEHKSWERFLSKIVHILLYGAMIGMPLSGWLMSSAGEYPVPFFGIEMPDLVGKDENLAGLMHRTHTWLGYMLIAAIGLHAAGAFKHHFLDKDDTLKRMSLIKGSVFPVVLVIVTGLALATAGGMILQDYLIKREFDRKFAAISKQQDALPKVKDTVNVDDLAPNQWAIVSDESSISFKGSVYGKDFSGEFPEFSGDIYFDPENLENSKAEIIIPLAQVKTGDEQRDTEILGAEWFNTNTYPNAKFVSEVFEAGQSGQYIMVGNLTIRDQTMPLSMPFSLDIKDKRNNKREARVKGSVVLNRLNYDLGVGQWEDPTVVGVEIPVDIDLTAVSSKIE